MTDLHLDETVWNPTRTRQLSTVVVGAGALGNEVVKALALLGIGRIHIVDPDVVEPGNLATSVFFRQGASMNQNKASAIKEAASAIFTDTEFRSSACEIADAHPALSGTDLIFSCVDSDLARLEIAYLSTLNDIPVAEGGLGDHLLSQGRATWFPGRGGACYGCKIPASRRRELLTLWQSNPHSCRVPEENVGVPSTPTMAAIIGSMQVDLGMRSLASAASASYSVEVRLDGVPRMDTFQNAQAAECPFHAPRAEVRVPVDIQSTAEQVLVQAGQKARPDAYVRLDWPVCTKARCEQCGFAWSPMARAGLLRRRSACPNCASAAIAMLESVQTFQAGDPWAGHALTEFGIAPPHSVAVRVG